MAESGRCERGNLEGEGQSRDSAPCLAGESVTYAVTEESVSVGRVEGFVRFECYFQIN